MKRLQISLVALAFLSLIFAAIFLNLNGQPSFDWMGFQVNRSKLGILMITSAVIFYFIGRLLGFIHKLKSKND